MPRGRVTVEPVEPARGISVRESVPGPPGVAELIGDTIGGVLAGGLHLTGGPIAIYHDLDSAAIDIEVFCPVDSRDEALGTPGGRTLVPRLLEGGEVAGIVFVGRYEDLATPYRELTEWIDANGYRVAGPVQEIYMAEPDEPGLPVTKIRMPVVEQG